MVALRRKNTFFCSLSQHFALFFRRRGLGRRGVGSFRRRSGRNARPAGSFSARRGAGLGAAGMGRGAVGAGRGRVGRTCFPVWCKASST